TTADLIEFQFQNYTLHITRGNGIKVDGTDTGLVFTAGAAPNLLIASAQGLQPPVNFDLLNPMGLPLIVPDTPGVFSFAITTDHSGLDDLDVGLRYFMTSADDPEYADTLRYPVFDLTPLTDGLPGASSDATQLQFNAVFDPVDQLNGDRTYLTIASLTVASPAAGEAAATAIRSYYLNPVGQPLRVAPAATAKLIFNTVVQYVPGEFPVPQPYYMVPAGDFAITAPPAIGGAAGLVTANVMCGVSAVEYVQLADSAANTLTFSPNCNAFSAAAYSVDPKTQQTKVQFSPLNNFAQTSWAWLTSSGGSLPYYAQPDTSVLFVPPASSKTAGDSSGAPAFLNYGAMQAGVLSGGPTAAEGATGFPMVPYSGIQGDAPDIFQQLELQVLSPTRRSQIPSAGQNAPRALGADVASTQGTTPQGLLLELEGNAWQSLTLAQSSLTAAAFPTVNPPAGGYAPVYSTDTSGGSPLYEQALLLYDVSGSLQAALQSNVVFLVASSGSDFLKCCSVPYVVTQLVLDELAKQANIPQATIAKLNPLLNNSYTGAAFLSALQALLSADEFKQYGQTIAEYSAAFQFVVQGFEFDMSPYLWDRNGTMLLFKFQNQTLGDLINDVNTWSYASEFNDNPQATQTTLAKYIQTARDSKDTDMQNFITSIVDNPNWSGILAINVQVPLTGLPPQLQGLAAGIDPALFQAHHIASTVTPVVVNSGELVAKPSSVSGLINYPDQGPITDTESDYQYKVRTLKMVLENSAITDFSSVVELLINKLFGDATSLVGSQNSVIDFNGIYQQQGSQGTYLFVNNSRNAFQMSSGVLNQIVISAAQFVTTGTDGEQVKSKFLFSGFIDFLALPAFDAFSFGDDAGQGGLSFGNLSVDLSFNAVIPTYKTFTFDAANVTLDTGTSVARSGSLYSHFPLKLTALSSGDSTNTPAKSNFMPVGTPLSSGGLGSTWYGLTFSLNLGTPGALAAAVGFNAGFIVAWSPGGSSTQQSLFIGLSLPGVKGGERAITLQGVIKLTFGDILFTANGDSYILQLRNIALKILLLTIPPSGQTNIILFGDPAGADRDTLG
ncbi:MAG: hemagglutinin protein, partial [Candidatus Solibacter sp.]|nr:hemagglutinin protein [Candidatus Solibacter sp.]